MDRNNIIGFLLLAALFTVWMQVNSGQKRKAEKEKMHLDSLAIDSKNKFIADSIKAIQLVTRTKDSAAIVMNDTASAAIVANVAEETASIDNKVMALTITNKGARIKEILLKEFKTSSENSKGEEVRDPLKLQESSGNSMEYQIPLANGTVLNTGILPSQTLKEGNVLISKTQLPNNAILEQRYNLDTSDYLINYESKIIGNPGLAASKPIMIKWINNLSKLEKNSKYEKTYSTLYYKSPDQSSDYVSYTKDATVKLGNDKKVQWFSAVNQFFNSSWIPEKPFETADFSIVQGTENDVQLKKTEAIVSVPAEFAKGSSFKMKIYAGPNEFNRLRAYGNNLEDVIQFGSSILGSINKWVVRPIFNFLGTFFNNQGLVILLLTLLVKLVLWPLTYKMIYSQSKMSSLKPQLEKLKEKHKDDAQKIQMETMAMYREFGVNPLGGCLPMLLQMPIWFALYRFFPAAIEFRQASFLWATDLSSYDVFIRFPGNVPLLGHHLSLFTVLWTVTTLLYTWYNFKNIDTTSTAANPALKYMQYIMPIIFMFFFNSFASGLTCYLVFSNIINILQTIVTKNYMINSDKIQKELDDYKKKPKKKGGFSEKLSNMLKEQQKLAEAKNAKK
ncbi:MAG: membrane protein insertase YidC [Saprospiraceae bacterium]|nr:membrane protein insertase YidC [Saprospiraceae bacterium]